MSKKLKTSNNNNTPPTKVPQWSSSENEDSVIIVESKSPKRVINLEAKGKKGSNGGTSSKGSDGGQGTAKIINLSALDNASSSSKAEPISSPPNLEKDSDGRLVNK
jgi:hypothetical protein